MSEHTNMFRPWYSATITFAGAVFACGGSHAGLNQTSITCPSGRTLLDGVCVSEPVADYVACVRAQGAQLGGERGQQISAEAGTLGVRAAGAAELKEKLEKKYSVSDQATMEIVRSCSSSHIAAKPVASLSRSAYAFDAANYWSDELALLREQTDPQECARQCELRADCRVATFCDARTPNGYANTCVLRSKVGVRHPEEAGLGIKSWVKP